LLKRLDLPKKISKAIIRINQFKEGLFKSFLFLIITTLLLFSLYTTSMIDRFKETTTKGNDYTYNIVLAGFESDSSLNEPYTLYTGSITFINDRFLYDPLNLQIYGVRQDMTLKRFYTDGRVINLGVLNNGVILSKHASITHDLNPLDTVTIRVGSATITTSIIAISDELVESALYMDQTTLNTLLGYQADDYNAYFTNTRPSSEDSAVLRIINYDQVVGEIETLFKLSNQFTSILMVFSSMIALIMFYFLVHKSFHDVLYEHAMLKALGYDTFRLYTMRTVKTFITISLSFFIGYFVVGYLLEAITRLLYDRLGFLFLFDHALSTFLLSYTLVIGLMLIVTIGIYIRFDKQALSTYLKR
jgi:ABC-type antimicrobial peptide transport system permease subunit